jgi:GNAT superfamily N-acetyltransferase
VRRDYWQRRIAELDPEVDFAEIYRIMGAHEFPWDMTQSLGLALYRTYAVPSIGELLAATGEFENRVHKRYADTGLILEAVLEHGFASANGRSAIRRMNQMHGAYAISNDDMRYVQSTFVVIPMRWLDRYGWRPLSEAERRASANYYRELGRHMNIKDSPVTYQEFAIYPDGYSVDELGTFPRGAVLPDERGNGVASDAVRALVVWLRDRLEVTTVTAEIAEANTASQRVALAAGFERTTRRDEDEVVWEHPASR